MPKVVPVSGRSVQKDGQHHVTPGTDGGDA